MIITLKPLLNRGADGAYKLPEDGFYQVIPYGEFAHKPTGLMQIVDNKAGKAILAAFKADKDAKAKADDPGILLCDYDHFSGDAKLPSKASGWIEDLQNRDDGIYAKIRWTPEGEKAVTSGDYRYPSPSFKPDEIEWIDNKTIRPLRLDRVGITNDPNMKTIKPLSNRGGSPEIEESSRRAVTKDVIDNAGNSAGARKGWITRHQGLASVHATLASQHLAAGRTGEAATHQKLAEHHLAKAEELKRKNAVAVVAKKTNPKRAALKLDPAKIAAAKKETSDSLTSQAHAVSKTSPGAADRLNKRAAELHADATNPKPKPPPLPGKGAPPVEQPARGNLLTALGGIAKKLKHTW
jgi:phage I-like protein